MGEHSFDVIVKDTPVFAKNIEPVSNNVKLRACGSCKSKNTVCIYYEASGCNIGWSIDEEYLCNECGKFTAYISEYDS